MENIDNELLDDDIGALKKEIEEDKELKFVNLLTEIIVSVTLKQLYEEGD